MRRPRSIPNGRLLVAGQDADSAILLRYGLSVSVVEYYNTGLRHYFITANTANSTECQAIKADPGWTYEGIAFYLFAPVDGKCGGDAQTVYRVYNNRFVQNDSNHRYTTDLNLYAQMQSQGWLPEGVVFCAPAQ